MGDNKVNGHLDFTNVKQTQLDMGQVIKGSFSELQSGLRVFDTNPILKDAYTHFSQEVNGNGSPTHVTYWQATKSSIFELHIIDDVAGNQAGTYIILEEYLTKRTIVFYCVVGGSGTAPGVGDVEYPVTFATNDNANIITYAFVEAINDNLEDFKATPTSGPYTSTSLEIEFLQFGEASVIDVSNSLYGESTIQIGESFKVGEVYLEYDIDGNPIFNGNTLPGLLFNSYTASFDVNSSSVAVTVNTAPYNDVEYGVKDVTATATLLAVGVSAQTGRRAIVVQPKGKTIWYGFDNTVTSGNNGTGFKLTSGSFATIELGDGQELYAITSSGTAKVSTSEMK